MLKKNNKNAQITVFVIIGIVMLITGIFLFFKNDISLFENSQSKIKNQVKDVVDNCLETHAYNGAFMLGMQGGFIDIPKKLANDPSKYIQYGGKIANWDSERNYDIPTINSMQKELNNYVHEQAIRCIKNDLNIINSTFDVEYFEDEFRVETKINDQNIVVDSNIPIKIKEKNSDTEFLVNDFHVKLDDVKLGDLYNLAVEIYNLEGKNNFLESLVLDQISSASAYDNIKTSMPSEGLFISCSPRIWTLMQLQDNLVNLNNNNFKYLQFEGTYPKTAEFEANLGGKNKAYQDYYKNNYFFKLQNPKSSFKDFNVDIFYPQTQNRSRFGFLANNFREFKVTPSNGAIVKAMNFKVDSSLKMPLPCIQLFHHLYTLDYDLIIRLNDLGKNNNKNFFFQFPLRVKIKNNNPKVKPFNQITTEPKTATNEKYCSNESKNSRLIVYAFDKNNHQKPISGVNISYKCVNLECNMGTTKKRFYNGQEVDTTTAKLDTLFPYCINGKVIANKKGYHTGVSTNLVNTNKVTNEANNSVDITLTPIKKYDVDQTTFYFRSIDGSKSPGYIKYSNKENKDTVYLMLENKENDFESVTIWPNDGKYYNTINFLKDDYNQVAYNLTLVYVDKEDKLRSLVTIKDWVPEIENGNTIRFSNIPAYSEINSENYQQYMDYVNLMINSETETNVDFKINFN